MPFWHTLIQISLALAMIAVPVAAGFSLLRRMKTARRLDGRMHCCPWCGCLFADERLFHTHLLNRVVLRCPDCGRLFTEDRFGNG